MPKGLSLLQEVPAKLRWRRGQQQLLLALCRRRNELRRVKVEALALLAGNAAAAAAAAAAAFAACGVGSAAVLHSTLSLDLKGVSDPVRMLLLLLLVLLLLLRLLLQVPAGVLPFLRCRTDKRQRQAISN